MYLWIATPPEPADAPANWCQGRRADSLSTNLGICHYKINGECPDWCYECSDTPLDCVTATIDFIRMLSFAVDWGVFVTGATIDAESDARVYFGTMDGRFIALELLTAHREPRYGRKPSRGEAVEPRRAE